LVLLWSAGILACMLSLSVSGPGSGQLGPSRQGWLRSQVLDDVGAMIGGEKWQTI